MGSFGEYIAQARKEKKLSQRELAEQILKEDGTPISLQYLNDIERGRRNPPPLYLIRQLAEQLDLPFEYLVSLAHVIDVLMEDKPPEDYSPDEMAEAFKAFRKALRDAHERRGGEDKE